jgi:anaerobic dimethyl sulfoxide reductase subunit A
MAHTVNTVCRSHCGGACPLKAHVEGGEVRRLENSPDYRACVRGRAYRQRLYATDRLLHPLKRTGPRGSGQFARISWDEALDAVASNLKRVKKTYGPEAIATIGSGGDIVYLQNAGLVEALLARFGGFSGTWGSHSMEGAWFASLATYGTVAGGNSREDLINSRLILLWGWNPVVTVLASNTTWHLARAREAGARLVSVDPRFNSTAGYLNACWVPIRPGTDTAVLVAMAQVIQQEGLQDQSFIDRFVTGYGPFRDYLTGASDGVPKTPAWAAGISGVPAETIAGLARDYATLKPAALMDGIAVGRTAYGEQFHRAAAALGAMTGNLGLPGGNAGGCGSLGGILPLTSGLGAPVSARLAGPNPVDTSQPMRPLGGFNSSGHPSAARVNRFLLADAILGGKAGGFPADYKLLYIVTSNYLNQCADTNRIVRALESLEFIVTHEQFMTATARWADIILPATTLMERNDLCTGGNAPWYGCLNKVVEPLGEAKSHFEICRLLAERLGVGGFGGKTEDGWVEEVLSSCRDIPDREAFRRDGISRLGLEKPYVEFEENTRGPSPKPFPTPSGKIELYSARLAAQGDARLPPIPQYVETWESPADPLAREFPLQLITTHTARRAHTTFETMPWLRELYPDTLGLNPADARARGLREGDRAKVFNRRGALVMKVRLTERLRPGVAEVPVGAWYAPGPDGVDYGGCSNVLTRAEVSPGGAFPSNTALVQVEKAGP